jgi:hypothetical protein
MSKKIEEIFDLPNVNDLNDNDDLHDNNDELTTAFDLDRLKETLETADIIDQALPAVRDLDTLDKDMDDYADQAMKAFQDLMDLGQNVEDRHAAPVFDTAAKMMTNAITAKTAKMDKKLKMIEMQMRKRKLDLEEKKVEMQIAKMNDNDDTGGALEGSAQEFDRNSIINAVLSEVKKSQSNDK